MKAVTGSQGQVSHCVALNNLDNFLEDNTNNDASNVISSEGCFACQMNSPTNYQSSSSNSVQQRNRKGRSRNSYSRRSRNYRYSSSQRKIVRRRSRRNTMNATFTSIRPCKFLFILITSKTFLKFMFVHNVQWIFIC